MLFKRLIRLKWRHLYNGALIYFKNIFHLLTFQASNLPKQAAKNTKNMTPFPCFVRPEKFHPYTNLIKTTIFNKRCSNPYAFFMGPKGYTLTKKTLLKGVNECLFFQEGFPSQKYQFCKVQFWELFLVCCRYACLSVHLNE